MKHVKTIVFAAAFVVEGMATTFLVISILSAEPLATLAFGSIAFVAAAAIKYTVEG